VPAIPWKPFAVADPAAEYVMLFSYLPLKSWSTMPLFMIHTWRIAGQLRRATGLIGYSLLARPLAREFFTLSVWENEAMLNAFVRAAPHAGTMADMIPSMGKTRFVTRRIKGSQVPPSWDFALSL
jgi:heme-degrading monooxygenase HmoA